MWSEALVRVTVATWAKCECLQWKTKTVRLCKEHLNRWVTTAVATCLLETVVVQKVNGSFKGSASCGRWGNHSA